MVPAKAASLSTRISKAGIICSTPMQLQNELTQAILARALCPQAGKLFGEREYIATGESFAIETTFSRGWILTAIQDALKRGFVVQLVYVCVDSPERNIRRVRERVARGGHDVLEDDIRRRYARSLSNARTVLKVVNHAVIYDNSGARPRKLIEIRDGVIIWRSADEASWADSLLENAPDLPYR